MKSRTILITGLALLTLLAPAWLLWLGQDASGAAGVPSDTAQAGGNPGRQPARAAASTPAGPHARPQAARLPATVRVDAARVLATVNQTPLQLQHLMYLSPGETQAELTRQQFNSRLERAIGIELTLQAAQAQGVTLTEVQQQRVARLALQNEAGLDDYRHIGVSWSSVGGEAVAFEQQLLVAQILEQNLVASRWAVAPSPNPEIQLRYEAARQELLSLLEAAATITNNSFYQVICR